MSVPNGAAYYHECYGVVNYYKRDILRYNSLDGRPVYAWFWWNGSCWQHESGVNSLNFKNV